MSSSRHKKRLDITKPGIRYPKRHQIVATNAGAGVNFAPTITAEIVDQFGNRVDVSTAAVLSINTGVGTLNGVASVNAVGAGFCVLLVRHFLQHCPQRYGAKVLVLVEGYHLCALDRYSHTYLFSN